MNIVWKTTGNNWLIFATALNNNHKKNKNQWCPRGDSNPHTRRHMDLNHARLPIPPPGQNRKLLFTVEELRQGLYILLKKNASRRARFLQKTSEKWLIVVKTLQTCRQACQDVPQNSTDFTLRLQVQARANLHFRIQGHSARMALKAMPYDI